MAQSTTKKLGVVALASVVVSSMVGGGIYSLPQNMAASASVGAVLIAWVITGLGMYFLANSFRILSDIRPDLKAGIYMYGREGFGPFVGFLIAWGYWLCQIFGNVGYAVITMDALNYFFPPYFQGGNTIQSIIGGSILIWMFNFVVLRGTQQAAIINTIGTIGKLIPLFINNIRHEKPLPVYGRGENVRDWLYVEDHARAIDTIFHRGRDGETYNIGGFNEWRNIDLIRVIIRTVDRLLGRPEGASEKLITYVTDRAGHDLRYAIDSRKLKEELGWEPSLQFEEGIEKTVRWYLANQEWMDDITSGEYERYYQEMYTGR